MSVVLKHFATQILDIVQNSLQISCYFLRKNYTWRLDTVQKYPWILTFFLALFFRKNVPKYISEVIYNN